MAIDPRSWATVNEARRAEFGIESPGIDSSLVSAGGIDEARQLAVAKGRDRRDPNAIAMDPRSLAARAPAPEKDSSVIVPSNLTGADAIAHLQASGAWEEPARIHETRSQSQRVTFYAAREDGIYVVAVEEAPEWDTVEQWRLSGMVVASMIPLLQALGVKLKDCSAELGHLIREDRREKYPATSTEPPIPDTATDRDSGEEFSGSNGQESSEGRVSETGRAAARRNRRRKPSVG